MQDWNPCLGCGVCCTHFRVSIYWGETDAAPGGYVPSALTEKLNDTFVCMQGTNNKNPRCIALAGEIGVQVGCQIYANRPQACRDFPALLEDGSMNPECQRLRALKGLPPLVRPEPQPDQPEAT